MAEIKCLELCKNYQQGDAVIKALDHVSLDIEQGSFICLSGPSGSGKTTLLNMIGGLDELDSGEISIDGQRVDLLGKGPLVLTFYRGAWCPYCSLQLRGLQETLPQFERYGAQVIAVTPQWPAWSREQAGQDGLDFELLSDKDGAVARAYRLEFDVDDLRVGEAFVVAGQDVKLGSTVLRLEEVRALSAAD